MSEDAPLDIAAAAVGRFGAIFDAVPEIMWITDAEGRVEFFNRQWAFFTGTPYRLGTAADVAAAHVHPDDVAPILEAFREARRTLSTLVVEHRIRSAAGTYRWFLVRAEPFRDPQSGRITRWFGVSTDIHEQKLAGQALRASEERLRLIVESVSDYAILTLDNTGQITSWNTGAERVFGFAAADAIGQHTAIIFTPEDRADGAHWAEMQRAAASGRAEDERWHLRKDGSRLYASGVLFRLGSGDPAEGFVKVARDTTDRKRSEDELRQAHHDLELRISERTVDLRGAVDALQAEVLERRAAEEQIKALFKQLVTAQEEERRRIARDIHDHLGQQLTALRITLAALSTATETEGGLHEHTLRAQQLAQDIDQSIDFLTVQLRPSALDHLGLPAAMANLVSGWSERFEVPAEYVTSGIAGVRLAPEVETNLYRIAQEALHNIAKHAHASRATVFLGRRADRAMLVIEDDGKGFDVAAEQQRSRGFGLLGMRERATLAGGEIEVESVPGHGTSVFVRVPLGPPGSTEDERGTGA